MKKLLIFHPYLAPYRIDVYNKLAEIANLKVALMGSYSEIATLGFDLQKVNAQAKFNYKYFYKGFRIGRHLISTIYYRIIKSFRPDIILAHELGFNTIISILLRKIFKYKIYITIDDSPAMAFNYNVKRETLRKWVLSHIDGCLVVNPMVKEYLEKKYKNFKCKYLYFPIIQNDKILEKKINASQDKAKQYVKQYALENKKIILFVGRLETIKAPEHLIQTYASLNDNNESKLIIVGKGNLQYPLEQYINKHQLNNKIILTGALYGNDLYAWYYLAHLFVLPSKHEPFGAVVNEALVAGCHTIVSDKVGSSALIDKTNGDVFPYGNDQELAQKLSMHLQTIPLIKVHQSLMTRAFKDFFNDMQKFMTI